MDWKRKLLAGHRRRKAARHRRKARAAQNDAAALRRDGQLDEAKAVDGLAQVHWDRAQEFRP